MENSKIREFAARCLLALITLGFASPLSGLQMDIPGPVGGSFGIGVHALPNGNFVVIDSSGIGSISLFDPAGNLISRLSGDRFGDEIGSNGIEILANGNFVVCSPHWSSATAERVGAVTWVDGTEGLNGTVSATNSLIGSQENDYVGSENGASGYGKAVFALANGNYVVRSANWNHGATGDAGAITWGNGESGTVGIVSPANSLVGSRAGEMLGKLPFPITLLANGNYVVTSGSSLSSDGTVAGAVVWGNGLGGTAGVVTEDNALFGATGASVTALSNGNYVVCAPDWSDGGIPAVGAVTWADGSTGIHGMISLDNSLVGTHPNDRVGYDGVEPLINGNFVVKSSDWNGRRGAATFGNGHTGIKGVVGENNSLVGRVSNDDTGASVCALTNGNYVVVSSSWSNNSGTAMVGAVTWGDGISGTSGIISAENSLVGRVLWDAVGYGGVIPLANGNYVVNSPYWRPPVGLGSSFGAVTFCVGDRRTVATVSSANSLVGSLTNDSVGSGGVRALANGNYVVGSPAWHRNGAANTGAVTWGSGVSGLIGEVSAANSLTGTTQGHRVGYRIATLSNGSYVVGSPYWSTPGGGEYGAITWGDGRAPFIGTVTTSNSLIGASIGERLGMEAVVPTEDGNYLIDSPDFSLPGLAGLGAIALRSGTSSQPGIMGPEMAVIGSKVAQGFRLTFDYDPKFRQLLVGHPLSDKVSIFHQPMSAPAEFSIERGTGLIARIRGEGGKRYAVQRSTNLHGWTLEKHATASASGIVYHEEENPASSAFYRLVEIFAD